MAYDVASSIKELLFEHDSIIIPGFGGFVLNGQSASIDYIKSTISPPAKVPTFNKNLTLNDGVLINYIKSKNDCSQEEANQILKNFIEEVNDKIAKKEIVEFPQVGRIYKDYNKSLQFLPYDTNFNTDVFGLPAIEAHPFSRNEEVKTKAVAASTAAVAEKVNTDLSATASAAKETPAAITNISTDKIVDPIEKAAKEQKEGKNKKGWAQATLPLLGIASILIVAVSYFFLFKKDKNANNSNGKSAMSMSVDDIKINEKPSTEDAEVSKLPSSSDEDFNPDDSMNGSEDLSTTDVETNVNDLPDDELTFGSNECIVIVGQFSIKAYAERFAEKLENDGYDYHLGWNEKKQWNTVGVKFNYADNDEKEDMLKILQEKYDEAAWILRD